MLMGHHAPAWAPNASSSQKLCAGVVACGKNWFTFPFPYFVSKTAINVGMPSHTPDAPSTHYWVVLSNTIALHRHIHMTVILDGEGKKKEKRWALERNHSTECGKPWFSWMLSVLDSGSPASASQPSTEHIHPAASSAHCCCGHSWLCCLWHRNSEQRPRSWHGETTQDSSPAQVICFYGQRHWTQTLNCPS